MRHWEVITCALALLMVSSCTMDDEDRCSSGYEYNSEYKYCFIPDTGSAPDTESASDSDTEPLDAGLADGGGGESTDTGGDTGSAVVETGIGTHCESDEECAGLVANYCVTSGGGYCSIKGCVGGDCPDGYTCCDCAGVGSYTSSACLNPESATLGSQYGCRCEE